LGDNEVAELRFQNIHYFAAGATLFGNEVQGAYQFPGQEYNGRNEHVNAFNTCVECHDTHALEVIYIECSDCHENVRGMAGEIATMAELLFAAMQAYTANTPGALPILYDSHAYPYFFGDADGDGTVSEGDAGYNTWTPNLLRAAYNYQYVQKDPGAFAHNGQYVLQILFDSIEAVGGDTGGMTRP
jgi:hypothetical protein